MSPSSRPATGTPPDVDPLEDAADPAPARPPTRRRALGKLLLFLLVLLAVGLVAARLGVFELAERSALLSAVERVRAIPLLGAVFVVAYALAVTFGLPASAFTLAGGALFGFWQGLLLNWIGATAGAMLAYLFAHALCGSTCRELLGPRAAALERVAERHGFLGTLRLRLIPVVPFTLLNYGAALAGVRRRDYFLATAIGIIPGAAVYTYFADSLLQGAAGAGRHALLRAAVAGALLILLSFVPTLVRRVRRR